MGALHIHLFGRFHAQCDDRPLQLFDAAKARELFAYLLLNRERGHSREALAGMLWDDSTTSQSRKYLRQALWQVQAGFRVHLGGAGAEILIVDPEWIRLNMDADLWVDVGEFDQSCALMQGVSGHEMDVAQFKALQHTADLYQGELLEGWYQDWCFHERTRLQTLYLLTLNKLMDYCEVHGDHELALAYGERIVRVDSAHERTHRRLMRLYYLAGERTTALRQYERCVTALSEQLGVDPSQSTRALYAQISSDQLDRDSAAVSDRGSEAVSSLPEILARLKEMHALVGNVQRQLREEISSVERSLALTEGQLVSRNSRIQRPV